MAGDNLMQPWIPHSIDSQKNSSNHCSAGYACTPAAEEGMASRVGMINKWDPGAHRPAGCSGGILS